ncbi:Nucleophile aminohydrolase, N-terminal [Sesbania bispinosa]|nr:Nucleophile aminohydrolase, N-terminal [Sesbania bispinosa]
MLAVFDKSVAKSPEALQSPQSNFVSALKDGFLAQHFSSVHPGSVTVNLGPSGILAYSLDKQNPLLPRLFAVVDDIFCLFQGHIENVANLKQQYGLNKTANEVIIVIEAYRTLRDRGPYPAAQVVRDFQGKFTFILFDSGSKTTFFAADADGSVPFFWGTDADGNLVLSDETEIVTKSCGKSSAPFPKVSIKYIRSEWRGRNNFNDLEMGNVGCYFTTSGGLSSFEHPRNELKPVPRVDSSGEVCGATFKVDADAKKETTGMPRVGSAANWSNNI